MQKIYLLLRDNKQSGPYSLGEIQQIGLKPYDLIWIEGRSAGWSYPSEIEGLSPFLEPAPSSVQKKKETSPALQTSRPDYVPSNEAITSNHKATSSKIHVSLPGQTANQSGFRQETSSSDTLEKKAEELRKRVQSYSSENRLDDADAALNTKYSRTLNDVEEEYTAWVYNQKAKKKKGVSKKQLLIALGIIVVLAGGYVIADSLSDRKDKEGNVAVSQAMQQVPKQEVLHKETDPGKTVNEEKELNITPIQVNQVENKSDIEPETIETEVKKSPASLVKSPGNTLPTVSVQREEHIPVLPMDTVTAIARPRTDQPQVPVTVEKKKKTLAQRINGFFDKIEGKKEGEPIAEAPPQNLPRSESSSERKSERRGESTPSPAESVDLANLVEITPNKPTNNNWTMGIQGLKITLYNRSNEWIKNAAVEVLYYSEQNSLLEKKTVHFTNIGPKKSATVPAPDHRLADHADYRLVLVEGNHDYVKQ